MNIRNVAIIAHVDHGKTTLVDALIRQTHTHLDKETASRDLIMDSNALERERGITIFSKNASVNYKGVKINIIDTPGHADFGGEVERVLKMADGCLLLIDAKEGPMPQTRFVLKKALQMKLKIIVVINKIDKPDARIDYVINKTFDLFIELGADEESAFFPTIYASGKNGLAGKTPELNKMTDISPILDMVIDLVPPPPADKTKPLQVLITNIGYDNFKGRTATGRVENGILKANQEVMLIKRDGSMKKARLTSLVTFEGLEKVDAQEVFAGDIIAITGIPDVTIGETIADTENPQALPLLSIEEPTVKMTFLVNDSPFAGQEGEFKTSRQIRERLYKELERDVALRVEDGPDGDWIVSGRGELHLAILIERMRREGYEFQVSRPQVITKEENGKKLTPYEELYIEVPDAFSGVVMQKMGSRHGQLKDMRSDNGITSMEFLIATKDLLGYRSEFLTETRGLGIINTIFHGFLHDDGSKYERDWGSLVAHETGVTTGYAISSVQDRGVLFVSPGLNVYKGEIVGQNSRKEDLRLNVCKEKQLTNNRSKGEGVSEHINTAKLMDLEDSLEYIADDELVEVTPQNIRLRKRILDEVEYRRQQAMSRR